MKHVLGFSVFRKSEAGGRRCAAIDYLIQRVEGLLAEYGMVGKNVQGVVNSRQGTE